MRRNSSKSKTKLFLFLHWAREQQYSAVLKLYIYRCTLDAICRIYISLQYAAYIYSCWRQYDRAENICVRLLPLSLVHILPNNLPQFGILWQYAGAENICAWDYWHSPQLILLHCTFPSRQFSQFCNMQYMQYANLILLALSKTSAAYLAVSSYCSVVDICAPQNNFNPKLSFWSTEKNPCQLFEGEYKIVSSWFSANTILSNHVFNCHHSLTMWPIVEWETEIKKCQILILCLVCC